MMTERTGPTGSTEPTEPTGSTEPMGLTGSIGSIQPAGSTGTYTGGAAEPGGVRDAGPSKAAVLGMLAVPLVVAAIAAGRPWITGRIEDSFAVGAASATGANVAVGLPAMLLVMAAALVAAVTSGRLGRRIALALLTVTAAGAAAWAAVSASDPATALGRRAAADLGRTGVAKAVAETTVWPWVAVGVLALEAVLGVAAFRLTKGWGGLSQRFETTAAAAAADPAAAAVADSGATDRGAQRGRVVDPQRAAWDALDGGTDPTLGPGSP